MAEVTQTTMFVFPGQGSQYRGMGSDLVAEFAVAKLIYERASDALGYDMSALSFDDAEGQLEQTRFTQPALLTHSVACMEVFKELTGGIGPDIVAGHSLGEYSGLVATQALTLEQALLLVRRRGELMSEYGDGEMVAFSVDVETVRPFAERHFCGIGGCNLPNQTVVGGLAPDIAAFVKELSAAHPKARATRLRTEGAFHTYLMTRAAMEFRSALDGVRLLEPRCRILSNYTGDFYEPEVDAIKYKLFYQLFHPVKWIWSMQRALAAGVTAIFEFGGGVGDGERPGDKRPNLGAIIQRTGRARVGRFARRSDDVAPLTHEPLYLPGINVGTLRHAAHLARSLGRVRTETRDDPPGAGSGGRGNAIDETWYHLYVPGRDNVPLPSAVDSLAKVDRLGLGGIVQIIVEPEQASAEMLERLAGERQPATPYLEKVVGCSTGALLYSVGPEMDAELTALRERLDHPSYSP